MTVIVRGPSGNAFVLRHWTQVSSNSSVPDDHTPQNGGYEGPPAGDSLAHRTPSLPEGTAPGAPARPHRDPRLTARPGTAPRPAAAQRPLPSRPPAPRLWPCPARRAPSPAPASPHSWRRATLQDGASSPDSWGRRRRRRRGSATSERTAPLPSGRAAGAAAARFLPASEGAQDASARVTAARPAASDPLCRGARLAGAGRWGAVPAHARARAEV